MIEAIGITQRHHTFPPPIREEGGSLFPPEEVDKQIIIGAEVTQQAIKANDWKETDIDVLVITSSLLPCPDFPERIAERAGLTGKTLIKRYFLACNGAVGALHDALRYGWGQVVITAVEGLSTAVDFNDLASVAIFGNGAASMAFSTQNKIHSFI